MTLNISLTQHDRDPQAFPSVRDVQNRLIARGYSVGPNGADGRFGNDSDAGVRRFQAFNGLVKDGVVGKDTWAKLQVSTTAPHPAAKPGSAQAMADLVYRWLAGDGLDGSRPAYVFGAEINLAHDSSPDRTDCSESVQYGVYRMIHDSWVDGSHNQWAACRHISVDQAIRTKGALLFQTGTGSPNGIHHVAISMGNGWTVEARSSHLVDGEHSGHPQHVGSWRAAGRFQYAGLIPVLHY